MYDRLFRPGVRLGGQPLFAAASRVYDFGDVGTATLVFENTRHLLNNQTQRRSIAKSLAAEIARATHVRIVSVTVGPPVPLALGQEALRFAVRVRAKVQSRTVGIDFAFALLRLDRAVGQISLNSYPGKHIPAATVALGVSKVAAHFKVAFTVRNLTPPTISGTAAQAQTLTADPGTWAGVPSGYTYQWSRCDAAGTTCTPIPGAIAQTYLLGASDAGARIGVTVTAANSVTSVALAAAPTAPVP
ncbi:MAG TPA: hypothetical protein VF101_01870 [Gaiellaceae bacterium]